MMNPDLSLGERIPRRRRRGSGAPHIHRTRRPGAPDDVLSTRKSPRLVNTFVTTKISYANMLAELCEHLPGGDIDVVTGRHRRGPPHRSSPARGR